MKTKKLTLLLTAAMFLIGGQNAVKADTTLDGRIYHKWTPIRRP